VSFRFNLFTNRKRDLDKEIEAHLQMAIQDRIGSGESSDTARQSVLREFGNVMLVKDVTGEQWGWSRLGRLQHDVRYAFRQLKRNPGLTTLAILMLAVGIGANTAVFSVFNQVLMQTMPVRDPNELVVLSEKSGIEVGSLSSWGDNSFYFSYPSYLSLRDGTHTLEGLAASAFDWVNLATGDSAENVVTEFVTGNYFDVVGVRPLLGRVLTPADDVYHKASQRYLKF
jgi:macrolide transport system ATP-binding/permease protein